MEKKLYPWQEQCLNRWATHGFHGIVQAVTGSGKTFLALNGAQRLKETCAQPLRVYIVVPTAALQRQWVREIRNFFSATPGVSPPAVGRMGGGRSISASCSYTVCIIHSARYRLARQILQDLREGISVLMIADECHHYASGQNRLIFEFLPHMEPAASSGSPASRKSSSAFGQFFSLGLTATLPEGGARAYLSSVLGPFLYTYGLRQATVDHTLCSYDLFHVKLHFQPEELEAYQDISNRMRYLFGKLSKAIPRLSSAGVQERFELLTAAAAAKEGILSQNAQLYMQLVYKRKTLTCMAESRLDAACELLDRLPENKPVLVFSERTNQADQLWEQLNKKYPQRAGCFHSKRGALANHHTLERFQNGEIRILIACRSLDEGFDFPELSVGIVLSGTASKRQHIQRLGRLLRRQAEKSIASLYYFYIAESSEESAFLPDSQENSIFELEYDWKTGAFQNPPYDAAASRFLEHLPTNCAGPAAMDEIHRCLKQGCVRSDWAAGLPNLQRRLEAASGRRERNYLICMKEVAKYREGL